MISTNGLCDTRCVRLSQAGRLPVSACLQEMVPTSEHISLDVVAKHVLIEVAAYMLRK